MDQVNMLRALQDIEDERNRQEEKFPDQHLPSRQLGGFPLFIAAAKIIRQWVQ